MDRVGARCLARVADEADGCGQHALGVAADEARDQPRERRIGQAATALRVDRGDGERDRIDGDRQLAGRLLQVVGVGCDRGADLTGADARRLEARARDRAGTGIDVVRDRTSARVGAGCQRRRLAVDPGRGDGTDDERLRRAVDDQRHVARGACVADRAVGGEFHVECVSARGQDVAERNRMAAERVVEAPLARDVAIGVVGRGAQLRRREWRLVRDRRERGPADAHAGLHDRDGAADVDDVVVRGRPAAAARPGRLPHMGRARVRGGAALAGDDRQGVAVAQAHRTGRDDRYRIAVRECCARGRNRERGTLDHDRAADVDERVVRGRRVGTDRGGRRRHVRGPDVGRGARDARHDGGGVAAREV